MTEIRSFLASSVEGGGFIDFAPDSSFTDYAIFLGAVLILVGLIAWYRRRARRGDSPSD